MNPAPATAPYAVILAGNSILSAPVPPVRPGAAPASAPRTFLLRPGPLDQSLAPVLEAIPRRAPLWVFLADAWCQTLAVPSANLVGQPESQRLSALAFEAEAFSALPPDTTATAAAIGPLSAPTATCRILQVPTATVEAVRRAADATRHPLAGLTHPALLAPLAAPDGTPLPDPPPFVHDDAPALLSTLAEHLAAATPPPAIHPVASTSPLGRALPLTLAISCGLLLLVLLAELVVPLLARHLRGALAERSGLAAQVTAQRQREASARAQADALRRDFEAAVAPRRALADLRTAIPRMLAALADAHATPDRALMLRSITSPHPFAYDLQTWAATPAAIDALYAALADALPDAGLALRPASANALALAPDGGPWLAIYAIAPATNGPLEKVAAALADATPAARRFFSSTPVPAANPADEDWTTF
ncbi:MAG: hypothetical protein IJT88_02170 [Kiritimatiellae bacterium]|nr:hypothetical protein [Kiritimatiellia bacterium]